MKMRMSKVYKMLLVFLIAIVSFGPQSGVQAQKQQAYNIQLSYAKAAKNLENEFIEKGNFIRFDLNKAKFPKTFLNLTLNVVNEKENFTEFNAVGVLRIENKTYQIKYDGELEKLYDNNELFYFGSLDGEAQTKGKPEESVLGLYFNPTTKDAIATVTVGTINERTGTAMLYFGEPSTKAKSNLQKTDFYQNQKNSRINPNKEENTVSVANTGDGPYTFYGNSHEYFISDVLTESEATTAPSSGYDNYPGHVGTIDVTEITRSESLNYKTRIRIFSNTDNVENYMQNKYSTDGLDSAVVTQLNLHMGASENVSIHDVYPPEQTQTISNNYWWIKYMGNTQLSTAYDIVSNMIGSYSDVVVDHTWTYSSSTGNKNQYTVYVKKNLGDSLDYPSNVALADSYKQDGGFTAFFPYDTYGSGTFNIELGGRIKYGVSNLPWYHGYVWTDRMSHNWSYTQ